jgi:hypothetical protein
VFAGRRALKLLLILHPARGNGDDDGETNADNDASTTERSNTGEPAAGRVDAGLRQRPFVRGRSQLRRAADRVGVQP